jgi:hypothetical protein
MKTFFEPILIGVIESFQLARALIATTARAIVVPIASVITAFAHHDPIK